MTGKLPEISSLIRALIARPSISSSNPSIDHSNLGVIHLLAEWLENLGFSITVHEVAAGKAEFAGQTGGRRFCEGGIGVVRPY